jgi:very-short-patch-repair endonuclease
LSETQSFLDPDLLSRWIEEFKGRQEKNNIISQTEKSVMASLKKINNKFTPSTFIPEIASVVDFYDSSTKTILQFDGPSHFLSNGEVNGSTRFQTRILEESGYTVFRLSYQDWDRKGEQVLEKLRP